MNGAREYYDHFEDGETLFGRIKISAGQHARGKEFEMFLLPKEKGGKEVCIYGVTGGQRGWTESYGWLHEGQWVDDFLAEYEIRVEARKLAKENSLKLKEVEEQKAEEEDQSLLEDY